MAYWHERVRPRTAHVIPPNAANTKRTGIVIRRSEEDYHVFQAHFLRWEGSDTARKALWPFWPDRRENAFGWFELWPLPPLLGPTNPEVNAAALAQLAQVDDGSADHLYEKRPYNPPAKPENVETINHPSALAKALIFKHNPDRFEVRYFSSMDFGGETDYVRTAVPGSQYYDAENRPILWDTLTLADNLDDARQIAFQELKQIVVAARSGKPQDTFIKRVPKAG